MGSRVGSRTARLRSAGGALLAAPTAADLPGTMWVVVLHGDQNTDGVARANELGGSTVTAGGGAYAFDGLPDGPYLVIETNPAGATSATDADGPANGNDLVAVPLS